MNVSQVSMLDVKLTLAGDNQSNIKRIQPFHTVKEILDVARQMATKEGVSIKAPLTISYTDADNELICVEDDSDLQMAYCIALSTDGKIKFIINYPQPAHVPPLVMPVEDFVVVGEVKPEPPKMVP